VNRVRAHWTTLALALLAFVPALTAAPGRMPSDSKLYLYLDPGRLIGDAASSFDRRQFAGWVPHQHIAYLWPSGPWFWLFDALHVPDWIAHRLWIGTLMLAAGLGVRWCARLLGLGPLAAFVAGLAYQVSPYVLPYVSRTSVMLLPWAGLGWIVGLTVRAGRRRTWTDPALLALVVLTVGAVNATALAMIVPAPVLWLVHEVWRRSLSWRQAAMVAVRISALAIPVSLWWIAMLLIQGGSGAEVLPYSESLRDVSFTATGTEIWRSLGTGCSTYAIRTRRRPPSRRDTCRRRRHWSSATRSRCCASRRCSSCDGRIADSPPCSSPPERCWRSACIRSTTGRR
jgi:arabinofuranan 3-O-arabinosyltransferase